MKGATDRMIEYIDYKGITKYKFCKNMGFSNKFLDNSSNMGTDKACKILHHYPDINPKWLLTGEGKMIINAKPNVNENATVSKGGIKGGIKGGKPNVQKKDVMVEQDSPTGAGFSGKKKGDAAKMQEVEGPVGGIPLIPVDAMAGFGGGEITVMGYETSRYVVPEFEELHVDFMIGVKGSSMYPKYNSGDIVACKKLSLKDLFFQWNKVYVLDTMQGALIKRIKKGKDQNHIVLHSDNPSYDPFELHISKVNAIAIVMGVIRLE